MDPPGGSRPKSGLRRIATAVLAVASAPGVLVHGACFVHNRALAPSAGTRARAPAGGRSSFPAAVAAGRRATASTAATTTTPLGGGLVDEEQEPTTAAAARKQTATTAVTPVGSRVVRLPARGTRVRLFYPTTAAAAAAAEAEEREGGGGSGMAPYGTDGRSPLGLASSLLAGVRSVSGCVLDAPLAAVNPVAGAVGASDDGGEREDTDTDDGEKGLFPLFVYSHGVGGNMDAAAGFFRTVASRGGAIVAAVEHTDGTASSTIRPDGSELGFSSHLMTERQQLARRASELLEAADYIPDAVFSAEAEVGAAGATARVRAVGRIVLGGHGWGAPSAVMAANGAPGDSAISGLILHDPTLGMGYGMLPPNGALNRLPTITYVSDGYRKKNVRYGARTIHVRGARHDDFTDGPLWGASVLFRRVDPATVREQLAESMGAFLRTQDVACPSISEGSLLDVVR